MITWLNPAALVALSAAALPIVIHLLLRARATTVRVPTIRFMVPTRESAVRLRRPSDLPLLSIRVALVGCAAIALASPLVITDARKARWRERPQRAVVVDTSASVDASAAGEAAAAQTAGASTVRRFDDADLGAAVKRAAAWLRSAPPGRLELVVISDFQTGTATSATFSTVPGGASISTMIVPRRAASAGEIEGGAVLYGTRRYDQRITFNGADTSYLLRESGAASDVQFLKGASPLPGIAGLAKTVAAAGIFAPPLDAPAVIAPITDRRWAELHDPAAIPVEGPPESLQAAIAVHDALSTRYNLPRLRESEPQTISSRTVESWLRQPQTGDLVWQRFDSSDARWFWLLAILLLAVEAVVRGRRDEASAERANAA